MPRYTVAYSDFISRIKEVELLLRAAQRAAQNSPTPENISLVNALCRSGVVMLSSHVEGYVEQLGELAVDQIISRRVPKTKLSASFRYFLSRDLIYEIRQSTDPSEIANKLLNLWQRDDHIWNSSPEFSQLISASRLVADFDNPKHSRITKFFARFGYCELQQHLAQRLAANFDICRNMIDQMVDQRNKIAHGNTVITGTPTDLAEMIRLVKCYCREMDQAVGDWFRAIGCPIR